MVNKIKQFFKKAWKWLIGILVGGVAIANLAGLPPQDKPSPVVEPTYFAEIDKNGTVLRVLVVTQKVIDSGILGDPKNWVQTTTDGSLRKNYAGKGFKYDKSLDAFVPPKPTSGSWILNNNTAQWKQQ